MGGRDFPAFLLSGVIPGEQYDPESDDVLSQLFRSYFLIRVSSSLYMSSSSLNILSEIARHIFLGPSFATDPPEKRNRACNAILNDVRSIEPEHIAYVCVHVSHRSCHASIEPHPCLLLLGSLWNRRKGGLE